MAAVIGQVPGASGASGSWKDRVRKGRYASPSGVEVEFDSGDTSREYELMGTVYAFPEFGGGYVQRTGVGARSYPIRARFSGANHDILALQFEAALLEPGTGKLSHPFYGTFDAIPLGKVTRRDDLVSAANMTVVEVVMWSTLGSVYPAQSATQQSEIAAQLAALRGLLAGNFSSVARVADAASRSSLLASLQGLIDDIGDAFDSVSGVVGDVRAGFGEAVAVANSAVDVLIGKPLLLAQQIVDLALAPGLAIDALGDRIAGYGSLVDRIVAKVDSDPTLSLGSGVLWQTVARVSNGFHAANLMASAAVAGAVSATADIEGQAQSRPEAMAIAAEVVSMHETLRAWRDDGLSALAAVDATGEHQADDGTAANALRGLVAQGSAAAISAAFALAPERSIVLGRERQLIELASEIYGAVDAATLDRITRENLLTADEQITISAGREIVWYA